MIGAEAEQGTDQRPDNAADNGAGAAVIDTSRAEQGRPGAVLGTLSAPGGSGATEVAGSLDDRFAFVSLGDSAELAVFLPNTDPLGALDAAERIRQQVASAPYTWQQTHVVATVSIGVSTVHQGQLSVDTMVHEAEQALEAAKEAGRNCVRTGPIKPRKNGERVST